MTNWRVWLSRLRRTVRSHRADADLDAEIQAHLDLLAAEHMRHGMSATDARLAARRDFGGVEQVKERYRDQRGWTGLESCWTDIRYAVRGLAANRAFTFVAIGVLTLGIGANTAIFSVIDAVMLQTLPIQAPEELTQLRKYNGATPIGENFSYPQVQAFAAQPDVFSTVFGVGATTAIVSDAGRLERVRAAWVTGHYYDALGMTAVAGRLLTPDDDRPEASPVAVITDTLWERKFGRAGSAIGSTLGVDDVPVVIIGVTPREFRGMDVSEVADMTLSVNVRRRVGPRGASTLGPGSNWLRVFGRLQPSTSRIEAGARLSVLWTSLVSRAEGRRPIVSPAQAKARLVVADGSTGTTPLRERFRQPLFVVMAIVALILLIACANVANLLLARGTARRREIAVRMALGASRARVVRQLLTEALILALAGAVGGVAVAKWASQALVDLLATGGTEPLFLDVQPNVHILFFAIATAIATATVFGVIPALRVSAAPPASLVNGGGSRVTGSSLRVASVLVIIQTALALVLLMAAGLFARTLYNLRTIDPGFRPEGVVLARVDGTREATTDLASLYERLRTTVERVRGVRAASFSVIAPPSGGGGISLSATVDGKPAGSGELHVNSVGPRYFEAMGTPVLEGREFSSADGPTAPRVVVVNQAFASRYMRGASAVGRRVGLAAPVASSDMSVVGVVKDAVYETMRAGAPPTIYVPFAQTEPAAVGPVTFEIATLGVPASVENALRDELQRRLLRVPVQVSSLETQVERTLVRERLVTMLATSFGLLGVALAAIGLYGLLAYVVLTRTKEIGIQLALGMSVRGVLWNVIGGAFRMLGAGVAVAIPIAWVGSRFVSAMLFGVSPADLSTVVAAAAILAAVCTLAAVVPARRASRLDPVVALRHD